MDDSIKKIIAWSVFILIITGIVIAIYYVFRNSPFGKGIGDLFGGAAGVLEALNKMIQGCDKHGWASPKGCPGGFAAILVGGLMIVVSLVCQIRRSWFPQGSTKSAEKLAVTENKPVSEIEGDSCKNIDETKVDEISKTKGKEVGEGVTKTSALKNIKEAAKKAAREQTESAQDYKEVVNMADDEINKVKENYDAEEQDIIDTESDPNNPDGANPAEPVD